MYRRPAWVDPPSDVVQGSPVELILAPPPAAVGLTASVPTDWVRLHPAPAAPDGHQVGRPKKSGWSSAPSTGFVDGWIRRASSPTSTFALGSGRRLPQGTNLNPRSDFDVAGSDPPTLRLVRWGYDSGREGMCGLGLPPPGRWPSVRVACPRLPQPGSRRAGLSCAAARRAHRPNQHDDSSSAASRRRRRIPGAAWARARIHDPWLCRWRCWWPARHPCRPGRRPAV